MGVMPDLRLHPDCLLPAEPEVRDGLVAAYRQKVCEL
jgi:hypothetical protein